MCFRKRVIAFMIDIAILMIVYMLVSIIPFYDDYILDSSDLNKYYYLIYLICLLIITLAFVCKDMIAGQSIGKRIMKIKIVNENGNIPNKIQIIIRSITFLIWPVEAFLVLMDKKRLGDRLARTNVIECEQIKEYNLPKRTR